MILGRGVEVPRICPKPSILSLANLGDEMSRAFLVVVFSLVLILCFPDSALGQPPTRSGYRVAWFDEFSGVEIEFAKWTPGNTNRPTHNSLQDYQVFLRIDYFNELYGEFESRQYIRSDSMLLADGSTTNDVWWNRELISVAPMGAVEARVALVFGQKNDAGGAVFIDNVEFSQIAVPQRSANLAWFVALGLSAVLVLSAIGFWVRSRRHC